MLLRGTAIGSAIMRWAGRVALATMATMATIGLTATADAADAAAERVFAAGSLRDAFVVLIAAYQEKSGFGIEPLYGPSGKLREQIQRGDENSCR
jgi:ABC-type molybdate transport system substrate-binding protein